MDLRGKSLVAIGGAGLIGSHTVDLLTREDVKEIIVYDNFSRGSTKNLESALKDPRVRVHDAGGDILHNELLDSALKNADGAFHFAALWLLHCHEYPQSAFDVNVKGTFNVMEACVRNGVSRLVYSSSASVYGDALYDPMDEDHPFNNKNFYGATKICGEAMLRAYHHRYGLDYVGLRYMNVYGPRQDYRGAYIAVIMKMLDAIDSGMAPTVYGDGSEAFDFVAAQDCGLANVLAMKANASDRCYNVGTGRRTSLRELAELLMSITGCPQEIQFLPRNDTTLVRNRIGTPRKPARDSDRGEGSARRRPARPHQMALVRYGIRQEGALAVSLSAVHTGSTTMQRSSAIVAPLDGAFPAGFEMTDGSLSNRICIPPATEDDEWREMNEASIQEYEAHHQGAYPESTTVIQKLFAGFVARHFAVPYSTSAVAWDQRFPYTPGISLISAISGLTRSIGRVIVSIRSSARASRMSYRRLPRLDSTDSYMPPRSITYEIPPARAASLARLGRQAGRAVFWIGLHDPGLVAREIGATALEKIVTPVAWETSIYKSLRWQMLSFPRLLLGLRRRQRSLELGKPLDDLHFHHFTEGLARRILLDNFGAIVDELPVPGTNSRFYCVQLDSTPVTSCAE